MLPKGEPTSTDYKDLNKVEHLLAQITETIYLNLSKDLNKVEIGWEEFPNVNVFGRPQ